MDTVNSLSSFNNIPTYNLIDKSTIEINKSNSTFSVDNNLKLRNLLNKHNKGSLSLMKLDSRKVSGSSTEISIPNEGSLLNFCNVTDKILKLE